MPGQTLHSGLHLVVGGDGVIGRALFAHLSARKLPVVATTRRPGAAAFPFLDLAQLDAALPDFGPVRVAYLCAAITSLAACRREPEASRRINVEAPIALAHRLADQGALVVGLSTNLVLDGRTARAPAEAEPAPQCAYGRQKADLERELLALGDRGCAVRLTKVIFPEMPLFTGWASTLRAGGTVQAFDDLVFSPIALSATVEALVRIGTDAVDGVVQLSGNADLTYADAARYLAAAWGIPSDRVRAVESSTAGVTLDARPRHTTLDTTRAEALLGWTLPDPWTVLDEVSGA